RSRPPRRLVPPPGLLADTAADGGLDARRAVPTRVRWGRSMRRATRNVLVVLGLLGAIVVVGMATFADRLAPHPPDEQNFDLIESRPSAAAVFGTDRFGRDVLSRVIYGARISLYVAITSIVASMVVGGALGLTAGYVGGSARYHLHRALHVFFSI